MKKTLSHRAAACLAFLFFTAQGQPAHADRPGAMSPQTITLPSGPAGMKGLGESFTANIATGTGNFSIPLSTVPGAMAPKLALSYTGGKGKGPLGLSFRLPVLNIYRTRDKGLPDYDEDDRFAVEGGSLNDELVLVDAKNRVYRLKNEGAFALFVRDVENNSWTIKLPSGDRIYLGRSDESRAKSVNNTYRWYVERQEDSFGHWSEYHYFKDQGYVYLDYIEYQKHLDRAYWNRVDLSYEGRPDPFTDVSYGAPVSCGQRLKQIEMSHGQETYRRYVLSYKSDLLFSLLSRVEMTGRNGEEMPPLSFEYIEGTRESGRYVEMVVRPPLEGLLDGRATFEDVNGDSLPDILYGEAGKYRYYENLNGHRWSEYARPLSNSPDRNLYEEDVLLADVDGNGYRDVVLKHDGEFRYYPAGEIRNGRLQGYRPFVTLKTSTPAQYHFGSTEVKMTDLNHDGRVDLLYQKPGQDEQILNMERDRLEGSYIAELPTDVNFEDPRLEMVDFNGDGVLDFALKDIDQDRGRIRVWLGRGHGRYLAEQTVGGVPSGNGEEFYLQDVNKDGQVDLVRVSGTFATYYLNNGRMGLTSMRGNFYGLPSTSETRKLLFVDMNGNGTTDLVWITLDWKLSYLDLVGAPHFGLLKRVDNGMGLVTEIDYRSSTDYLVEAKLKGKPWKTPLPISVPVISEVRTTDSLDLLGLAATETRVTYTYRDGYYDGEEREFRGFAQTVTTEWGDAYHETQMSETHMHVGRNLETGADEEILKGKPWLQTQRDLSGNLYTSAETRWEQRWMCQEELVGVEQAILPRCNRYTALEEHKDDLVAFGVQTASLSGSWEKTGTPKYTGVVYEYDPWGNAIRTEKYGEVQLAGVRQPGAPFDLATADVYVGDDEVAEETDYLYDVDKWRVGVGYAKRVLGLDGVIHSQSRTFYDGEAFVGLPLGEVGERGLVSRETAWYRESEGCVGPESEECWVLVKGNSYNGEGLLIGTKDANGNLVELEYDGETGQFPAVERFHVESGELVYEAEYDTGWGAITRATDFNGHVSRYFYDGLGRIEKVVDALSSEEQPTTRYEYEYGYPVSTVTTWSLVDRETGEYRRAWQYSDGLGRTRQTKSEAEAPFGYIASSWKRLSPRGQETHSYDVFSSSVLGLEPPPSGTPVTVTHRDALGRATEVYLPDTELYQGTYSLTQYLPFETRVYDQRDTTEGTWEYPAITKTDGQGRVREIVKRNDFEDLASGSFEAKWIAWQVGYDTLGNITSFTDPKGNRRDYRYDSLGRMVSLSDPNMGEVFYEYDTVGNLTRRTDSLGQIRTFIYGVNNRLKHADFWADAEAAVPEYSYTYHYDEPAGKSGVAQQNLKGNISRIEWPAGEVYYSFDELGRLSEEHQMLWDPLRSSFAEQERDHFSQRMTYNALGDLLTKVQLRNGQERSSFSYRYNQRSLVDGVEATISGEYKQIVPKVTYDHRGKPMMTDNGNQTTSCAWYDARATLLGMKTGPTGEQNCQDLDDTGDGAFLHLLYDRTPTGMISKVHDLSREIEGVPRLNGSYGFDRLYQLVDAQTEFATIHYAYDEIQNLLTRQVAEEDTGLLEGYWRYGENAGPAQLTSVVKNLEPGAAPERRFVYDAVGQMQQYNGYALTFDIEGRLTQASKPGEREIEAYYDHEGARRILVETESGSKRVKRNIFADYKTRDEDEIWLVSAGTTEVEARQSHGIEVDLFLKDELVAYVNAEDKSERKQPLPAEYMDLDGDGNGFTQSDLDLAVEALWSGEKVGGERLVWQFHHKDHLTGTTHVADYTGQVVSHQFFHPYGSTAHRDGLKPLLGFAGSENLTDSDFGLRHFGARWYAPDIGRWVSGDFLFLERNIKKNLKSTFESGLFAYVANNPIKYIDTKGLEIQVAGSTAFRRTVEQKLKNIDPSVRVDVNTGAVTFHNGTETQGHNAGHRLLERLDKSRHVVTIQTTSSGSGYSPNNLGTQSGGIVNWNPNRTDHSMVLRQGRRSVRGRAPKYIVLGHELIHADHAMRGSGIRRSDINQTTYRGLDGNTYSAKKEEQRTVGLGNQQRGDITENDLRRENNVRNRSRY